MHTLLLVLGLFAVAAGAAMVGFGLPNNEFGTGNMLIGAGTQAIVGGLIVIGLSAAVRELHRVARALEKPSPRRAPPVSAPSSSPEPGAREPRLKTRAPFEPAPSLGPPMRQAPAGDIGDLSRALAEPPVGFDDIAADVGSAGRDPFAPMRPADRRDSGRDRAPEDSPPVDQRAASEPVVGESARGAPAVGIIKSGVIDGMAYTLYSDGSIEAELPQGTLRFGSLEKLRRYAAGQG